jgi:hypothetical protein
MSDARSIEPLDLERYIGKWFVRNKPVIFNLTRYCIVISILESRRFKLATIEDMKLLGGPSIQLDHDYFFDNYSPVNDRSLETVLDFVLLA